MMSNKWIPGRKVLASGVGGLAAFLGVTAADQWLGISLPLEAGMALVGGLMSAVGYLVPTPAKEVVRMVDTVLKNTAAASGGTP